MVCNFNNIDEPQHNCLDISNTSSNGITAITYGITTAYDQLFYPTGAKTFNSIYLFLSNNVNWLIIMWKALTASILNRHTANKHFLIEKHFIGYMVKIVPR